MILEPSPVVLVYAEKAATFPQNQVIPVLHPATVVHTYSTHNKSAYHNDNSVWYTDNNKNVKRAYAMYTTTNK